MKMWAEPKNWWNINNIVVFSVSLDGVVVGEGRG